MKSVSNKKARQLRRRFQPRVRLRSLRDDHPMLFGDVKMLPEGSIERREEFFADGEAVAVPHEPEIRVESGEDELPRSGIFQSPSVSGDHAVDRLDYGEEISLRPLADIYPVWLDERSEESDSLVGALEIYLFRMELKPETLGQESPDRSNRPLETFAILVDQDEIVHVPSIVPDLQSLFHENIEIVEVEVRENLAREVADREADSRRRKKEALRPRQSDPILLLSFYDAVFRRIVANNLLAEPEQLRRVVSGVLRIDDVSDLGKEDRSVDIHEKPLYVELQDMRGFRVIFGRLPDEPVDPADPEERPFSFPATVAVVDEELLKDRIELADDEMMDDPVAEIAGEYLALDRFVHDEGDAFADFVPSGNDLVIELNELRFVVELEGKRVRRAPLVAPAFVVGFEKFGEFHKKKEIKKICHSERSRGISRFFLDSSARFARSE